MLNLALTSDFPSTRNEAAAACLSSTVSNPRVAWVAPQSSLAARTRYLAAQLSFRSFGVNRLEYCAIDDDTGFVHLDEYDAVYLTGGDPLLFQRRIQGTGLGARLVKYLESSRPIVAASGGAMQLTANVSLFRLLTCDLEEVLEGLTGYEGLHVVPHEILPHLNRHDESFLEKVRLYSEAIPHGILALADGAGIIHAADTPTITGRAEMFLHGVRMEIDRWPTE
jgi:peptidase E